MAATALAFFVLICTSLVHAQVNLFCPSASFGDTSGDPVELKRVDLAPPTRDWDLRIPQECPNGAVVGINVMVCDPSAPPQPTISILNTGEVLVQRNAYPVVYTATVYTTLYCDTLQKGSIKDSNNLRRIRINV